MSKRLLTIAATGLVLGVIWWGTATRAQDAAQGGAQAGAQPEHMGHGHWANPDEQLQRMSQALNLTDDQKSQIKPILVDRHKQMEALRSDASASEDDKRAKMRSLMQDSNSKIRAVLNDEQKQKFDEMQQRMHERTHKPPAPANNP